MSSIRTVQWPISDPRPRQGAAAFLMLAGFIHETRGRWSVLRGTISHNDVMRASGHRQQLVGMLQRFWKKDRRSVEVWVDTLLRRGNVPSIAISPSWRAPGPSQLLHQEP